MKIKSCKNKGLRLCKEVKQALIQKFDLFDDDIVLNPSSVPGEDLILSPRARAAFPFSVECKNTEKLKIWEDLKQAESQNRKHTPMVIFSRNRSKTYVVVELNEFLKRL